MAITLNGTTGISGVNGSAGTPALQGTDTNTGIFFGTDEVSIATGGSNRLIVDSSGRVGLGTSSPSATTKMSIVDSTSAGIYLLRTAQGETVIENTGPLTIRQSSGNGANQNIFFKTGASVGTEVTAMTIDGSQRVGIGTTSPSNILHLYRSTGSDAFEVIEAESSGNNAGLLVKTGGNNLGYFASAGSFSGTATNLAISATSGAIEFRNGGSNTERARIDSSGRLLVGTSSDFKSIPFQVRGSAAIGYAANDAFSEGLFFTKTRGSSPTTQTIVQSGDALGVTIFQGSDGTAYRTAATIQAEVDGTPGANDMPGRLVFATTADGASSPTERMRIGNAGSLQFFDSAGFFGIASKSSKTANTTDNLFFGAYGATGTTDGTACYVVRTNGNVLNANNSYAGLSDFKLKENIIDANSQWDDLKALQVRNYNFKEGQTHTQIGLIAQEVELVSPGLVNESPDRDAEGNDLGTVTKSVNYSVLYMKAVKALQEAMERIETLEAKVAVLEAS